MRTMRWRAGWVLATALVVGCGSAENRGVPRHPQQRIPAADALFELAKDPPITADTYFAAGQLAESQGNFPKAAEQYAKALEADGRHDRALFRLAMLQSRLGRHAHAIRSWHRYIELTGHSAAAYSNLGYACELAGQPREAEAAYLKGIEIDPGSQPCRVNYGLMLARAGQSERAVEQLSAVLPPAQVHYNLASVYESLGQRDRARAEYRRSLELDPTLRAAQARLAALE